MTEWQPIDTVPRDGSLCLVSDGGSVVMARGLVDKVDLYVYNLNPTHWMPLPPAPKAEHGCKVDNKWVEVGYNCFELWEDGFHENYPTAEPRRLAYMLYCPYCGEQAPECEREKK